MKWQVISPEVPQTLDEVRRILLVNRNLTEQQEIAQFLSPPLLDHSTGRRLVDLLNQAQLGKAVELVDEALHAGAPIIIHGDYDVDGVSATAILWEAFYHPLGYRKVWPFVPHRLEHGYGVSQDSIDALLADPRLDTFPLLITVDCGITSKDAINYARSKGVKVIVTDHHVQPQNPADLVSADAVLHTTLLSGTGIAWLFSQVLLGFREIERWLDLVALATIADLVPLTGYNRLLVKWGLPGLTHASRVGLRALKQVAGIEEEVSPYHVSWLLGPRLNAPGRLEAALDAVRLLCTRNPQQALKLARKLDELNQRRQRLTQEALDEVEEAVLGDERIIVLSSPRWHEGIIGLLAGKVVERFHRPAIVIAQRERVSKASARSIKGVNIVEIIRRHQELLLNAGGHELAAGFSIETSKISNFKERILSLRHPALEKMVRQGPTLKIDLELPLWLIGRQLYQFLTKLEPYGVGNPRPVFLSRRVMVRKLREVGAGGKHLQMNLVDLETFTAGSGAGLSAVAFDMADKARQEGIGPGSWIDVVYTLDENNYRGSRSIQLKVKDFRLSLDS